MNKKIGIFSVTMLLVLFLSSCFSTDENPTASISETNIALETSAPAPDVAQTTVEDDLVILGSGFLEYDESVIGEVENTVLFFHQESCSTCKATEADLIENGLPIDTQVLKIDFDADSSTQLKQKYGVTMKHTFVQVDADGNMIKKWNGSLTGQDILDKVYQQEEMIDDSSTAAEDTATTETIEQPTELAGVYADYDSSLVGQTDETVLFFHAAWCPSCVAADKEITAGNIPEGLTVLKTDFDINTDLRQKYGVTGQHTFVQVDENGEMIKKWVGGSSIENIVEKVQ
ncbi:thioredoxin family protein [Candidatus Gracilibacteria bacterium]|nr:thioredoxin family protein [Candidatus Gracilibacteria bacterium]